MTKETILSKLERRFGRGSDPKRRHMLYTRIADLVIEHGDIAYKLLCEVAAEAAGATQPDRYFCRAITRRFSERGIAPQDF